MVLNTTSFEGRAQQGPRPVALVALSGQMEKKVDDRADSKWPAVAVNTTPADSATSSGG
ncbi:hypothetical protein ACFQ67_26500 [Streptomyces sp. NPDC056488]|uniref:hypothetical protein n=1 Tax=Streptomyces sp. NPDC056488 TaxID=3345836 RepID=UPI0036C91304